MADSNAVVEAVVEAAVEEAAATTTAHTAEESAEQAAIAAQTATLAAETLVAQANLNAAEEIRETEQAVAKTEQAVEELTEWQRNQERITSEIVSNQTQLMDRITQLTETVALLTLPPSEPSPEATTVEVVPPSSVVEEDHGRTEAPPAPPEPEPVVAVVRKRKITLI